MLETFAVDL